MSLPNGAVHLEFEERPRPEDTAYFPAIRSNHLRARDMLKDNEGKSEIVGFVGHAGERRSITQNQRHIVQIGKVHASPVDHFLTDVDSGDVAEDTGEHSGHSSDTAPEFKGCEIQRRSVSTAYAVHIGHHVGSDVDFTRAKEFSVFPLLCAVHDVVLCVLSRAL